MRIQILILILTGRASRPERSRSRTRPPPAGSKRHNRRADSRLPQGSLTAPRGFGIAPGIDITTAVQITGRGCGRKRPAGEGRGRVLGGGKQLDLSQNSPRNKRQAARPPAGVTKTIEARNGSIVPIVRKTHAAGRGSKLRSCG